MLNMQVDQKTQPLKKNPQQSNGELFGEQTASINALIEQNAQNSSSQSLSPISRGSSDSSSSKVAIGVRVTDLLLKLSNEIDPAK